MTFVLLAGDVEPNPGPYGSIDAHGCRLAPALDYRRDNNSNQSLNVGGGRRSGGCSWTASMDIMLQSSLDALSPCVTSGLDSTSHGATQEENSGTLTHASGEFPSLMLGIATHVKQPASSKRKLTGLNPAIRKHCKFKFFQTLKTMQKCCGTHVPNQGDY